MKSSLKSSTPVNKIRIITHRGLEPEKLGFFAESSLEAFEDQLERGFGLEFDVQFTSDGEMIAVHDSTLKRITAGKDERKISEVTAAEMLDLRFEGCRLTTVGHVLKLIAGRQAMDSLSALHLKIGSQLPAKVDTILSAIESSGINPDQFIIFDVNPETARYIKRKMPELQLAASVSHPYDIERYNTVVGGTLLTLEETIRLKDLYSWAWLDEWDLADKDGKRKKFCTQETFDLLRKEDIRIALVTPELHAKSPGLLGGEAHEDGVEIPQLFERFQELAGLRPDAMCTDYPERLQEICDEVAMKAKKFN